MYLNIERAELYMKKKNIITKKNFFNFFVVL